jgi:hypothetical protein
MLREAQLLHGEKTVYVSKSLLDTGAQEANYIGGSLVERFDSCATSYITTFEKCIT